MGVTALGIQLLLILLSVMTHDQIHTLNELRMFSEVLAFLGQTKF